MSDEGYGSRRGLLEEVQSDVVEVREPENLAEEVVKEVPDDLTSYKPSELRDYISQTVEDYIDCEDHPWYCEEVVNTAQDLVESGDSDDWGVEELESGVDEVTDDYGS
ncbi:MAG: hypothetical protein ABEJ93_01400 [Candidatus Nanohalobium sp.]